MQPKTKTYGNLKMCKITNYKSIINCSTTYVIYRLHCPCGCYYIGRTTYRTSTSHIPLWQVRRSDRANSCKTSIKISCNCHCAEDFYWSDIGGTKHKLKNGVEEYKQAIWTCNPLCPWRCIIKKPIMGVARVLKFVAKNKYNKQ